MKRKNNKSKFYMIGLIILSLLMIGGIYYLYGQYESSTNEYSISVDTSEATVDATISEEGLEAEVDEETGETTYLSQTSDDITFTMPDGSILRFKSSDFDVSKYGGLYVYLESGSDPFDDESMNFFVNSATATEFPFVGLYAPGTVNILVTYKGTTVKNADANIMLGDIRPVSVNIDIDDLEKAVAATSGVTTNPTTDPTNPTPTTSDIYQVVVEVTPADTNIYYEGSYKGTSPQTIVMSKYEIGTVVFDNSLYVEPVPKSISYNDVKRVFDMDTIAVKKTAESIVAGGLTVDEVREIEKAADKASDDTVVIDDEMPDLKYDYTFITNVPATISYYDESTKTKTSTLGKTTTVSTGKCTLVKSMPYSSLTYTFIVEADGYESNTFKMSFDKPFTYTSQKITLARTTSTGGTTDGYYGVTFYTKGIINDYIGTAWHPEGGNLVVSSKDDFYVYNSNKGTFSKVKSAKLSINRLGMTGTGLVKFKPGTTMNIYYENAYISNGYTQVMPSTAGDQTITVYVCPDYGDATLQARFVTTSAGIVWVQPVVSGVNGPLTSDMGSVIDMKLAEITDLLGAWTYSANHANNAQIWVTTDNYDGKSITRKVGTFSSSSDVSTIEADAADGTLQNKVYSNKRVGSIPINLIDGKQYIYIRTYYDGKASLSGEKDEITVYKVSVNDKSIAITQVYKNNVINEKYGNVVPSSTSKTPKEIALETGFKET